MASKYSKDFKVPSEFPSVLKSFTREVLRSQPENIYEFGASYFADLLEQVLMEQERAQRPARLTADELKVLFLQLFVEADADGSETLDINEFKNVLVMADLGLTEQEMNTLYAEADVNDDGEIEYHEFVPIAVDVVQGLYARMDAQNQKEAEEDEALAAAEDWMLHGMSAQELEAIMIDIFRKADTDGSGELSMAEFRQTLKEADLGLTRREVNALMMNVDKNQDGSISYEEFVPLCKEILTVIMKEELRNSQQQPSQLEVSLVDIFSSADEDGSGALPLSVLREMLRQCDLGLTRLQIHTVLASATEDEDGQVAYESFAKEAAEIIFRLLDPETVAARRASLSNEAVDTVHSLGAAECEAALLECLQAADASGSGKLGLGALRQALAASSLGLTPKEVTALMSVVEPDNDGVDYRPLAQYAFNLLQFMANGGHI